MNLCTVENSRVPSCLCVCPEIGSSIYSPPSIYLKASINSLGWTNVNWNWSGFLFAMKLPVEMLHNQSPNYESSFDSLPSVYSAMSKRNSVLISAIGRLGITWEWICYTLHSSCDDTAEKRMSCYQILVVMTHDIFIS